MVENEKFPEPQPTEIWHTLARGATGSIPLIGPMAAELFGAYFVHPVEARRAVFLNDLASRLIKLEAAGYVSMHELQQNPVFVSTLVVAVQKAAANHAREKLDALHNAVLNAALAKSVDDSKQQIFVQLIDSLTPWHLNLLHFLNDSRNWFSQRGKPVPEFSLMTSLQRLIFAAWPELEQQQDFLRLVGKSLDSEGLANTGGLATLVSPPSIFNNHLTAFGREFLTFIEPPSQLDGVC